MRWARQRALRDCLSRVSLSTRIQIVDAPRVDGSSRCGTSATREASSAADSVLCRSSYVRSLRVTPPMTFEDDVPGASVLGSSMCRSLRCLSFNCGSKWECKFFLGQRGSNLRASGGILMAQSSRSSSASASKVKVKSPDWSSPSRTKPGRICSSTDVGSGCWLLCIDGKGRMPRH